MVERVRCAEDAAKARAVHTPVHTSFRGALSTAVDRPAGRVSTLDREVCIWLAFGYVLSALVELAGLVLVVYYVWRDRQTFAELRWSAPGSAPRLAEPVQSRRGMHHPDRRLERLWKQTSRSDEEIVEAYGEALRWHRLIGPVLIGLGVFIGMAANIAALQT